jgi:hypothetical protein
MVNEDTADAVDGDPEGSARDSSGERAVSCERVSWVGIGRA